MVIMAKSRLAWRQMSHDDELPFGQVVRALSTKTTGPSPEFLTKKRAEQAPRTADWHQESLMQLWAFLEGEGLVTVGDFTEQTVHLFRVHLRGRGVSENTVSNRLRSIRAFSRWMADTGWTRRGHGTRKSDVQQPGRGQRTPTVVRAWEVAGHPPRIAG